MVKICFKVSYFVCVVYLWSFVLGMQYEKEMEVIKLCFSVHCRCFWKMYINMCVMFLFVLYNCCKNCEHFLGANGEHLYKSKVFSIVLKWFLFFLNVCVFLVIICSSYVRVIYCHDPNFGLTIKGKA